MQRKRITKKMVPCYRSENLKIQLYIWFHMYSLINVLQKTQPKYIVGLFDTPGSFERLIIKVLPVFMPSVMSD